MFRRILAAALCAAASTVFAADWPAHPANWIVSYPPGGTTDVLARIMATWLSEKLGQQFVNPANGINATLYKDLPFSVTRDLAPVAGLIRVTNVMEVTNAFPAKTVSSCR
jgi:tripartite-type tricarboxylate transporter receptor subunit TctC